MKKYKVGIIILMKGNVWLTKTLLNSVNRKESYDKKLMTFYIADTGSSKEEKNEMKKYLASANLNCKYLEYDYYNFAKINNDVVKNYVKKSTDLILLCNNDIEFQNDAIANAVKCYDNNADTIGTVGALLSFEDGNVQHGGININRQGNKYLIRHYFIGNPAENEIISHIKEFKSFGNTGAFLLVSKKDWDDIGGLNENYKDCFEDVEFNLSLLLYGRTNITCFDAKCIHRESSTRHQKLSQEDINRVLKYLADHTDELNINDSSKK